MTSKTLGELSLRRRRRRWGLTCVALLLISTAAVAEDDEAISEARARFNEGVTLFDQGKYDAAHVKFKQAYALRRHPDVLLNLGSSSLKAGRKAQAADEFEQYLREAKDAPPEKRAEAERGLAEARGGASTKPGPPAPTYAAASNEPSGGKGEGAKGEGGREAGRGEGSRGEGSPRRAGATASDEKGSSREPEVVEGSATGWGVAALLGVASRDQGLGLGVRFWGHPVPRVYLGVSFHYHFGRTVATVVNATRSEVSSSAFFLGPEGGYDFTVGKVVLRPYGGLGLGSFRATFDVAPFAGTTTDNRAILWLGGMVLYDIEGSPFSVGGDLRILALPGGAAAGAYGMGAFRF